MKKVVQKMPRYIEAVKSAEIISEKLNIPLGDLVDVFAEIPTADVAEVVKCKDCKYYDGFYSHRCTNTDLVDSDDCYARIEFSEDDFCSYGERKESD